MTDKTSYAERYRGIDFRKCPERYLIGRGEQGVLIAEPYKSELLPHWKFKTADDAKHSAETIYEMFEQYRTDNDFVGMDMARKFLQMGFTRARRYANHEDGRKYDKDSGRRLAQNNDALTSEKAISARIFHDYYTRARTDAVYVEARKRWQQSS